MNEPSLGEALRRLDQIQALITRLVSVDLYDRDRREDERRFAEIQRDVDDVRRVHAEDIKAIRELLDKRDDKSGDWRKQMVFTGLIPALFFLLSTLVTVVLALRSGK